MPKGEPLSDKMRVQIRRLRRQGISMREIAKLTGTSLSTVQRACKLPKASDAEQAN